MKLTEPITINFRPFPMISNQFQSLLLKLWETRHEAVWAYGCEPHRHPPHWPSRIDRDGKKLVPRLQVLRCGLGQSALRWRGHATTSEGVAASKCPLRGQTGSHPPSQKATARQGATLSTSCGSMPVKVLTDGCLPQTTGFPEISGDFQSIPITFEK